LPNNTSNTYMWFINANRAKLDTTPPIPFVLDMIETYYCSTCPMEGAK